MSKVKLTTVSGTVIEKPVITCFKNEIGTYVVLDNEKNGTMGLPIILVSRLFDGKLTKIIDQGEWQKVKENLKAIIAGNAASYEVVPEELRADDVYYTQLTLPVNSFDTLKSAYSVPGVSTIETPVIPESQPVPTVPEVETPSEPAAPVMPEVPTFNEPVTPEIPSAPETPVVPEPVVAPEIEMPSIPGIPNVSEPVAPDIPATPETPVVPEMPAVPEAPVPPQYPETPAAPEIPAAEGKTEDEIAEMKKTFIQSCENLFDAMVMKLREK